MNTIVAVPQLVPREQRQGVVEGGWVPVSDSSSCHPSLLHLAVESIATLAKPYEEPGGVP